MSLRAAMQICSTWTDLRINERWVLGVRADVVNHRIVNMTVTNLDHDCDHCFEWDVKDSRPDEDRYTIEAVSACMREQLSTATFDEETCTYRAGWLIQNDW